jgi:hypothetical protein
LAKFRINQLLKITNRPSIYLCGDIIDDGQINKGCVIYFPVHDEVWSVKIKEIEFVDYRTSETAEIALGILLNEEEKQLLENSFVTGMIVEIDEVSSDDL